MPYGVFTSMNDKEFNTLVDELVLMSTKDSELREALQQLDFKSRKENISFYECVKLILRQRIIERKAEDWYKAKFDN